MVVASSLTSLNQHRLTGDAQILKQVFNTVDGASCPHTFNFHMHTVCSDGKLTPAALMEQVIAIGLQAFAITDHHSIEGFKQANSWLEDWRWRHPTPLGQRRTDDVLGGSRPRLFTGVEITAVLAGIEVHILGYGFAPNHGAIAPYLKGVAPKAELRSAESVIQAIQAAGGLAVLAHPARYRLSTEELVASGAELGMDGVETYYAYNNPEEWQPCPRHTPEVEGLAQRYGLLTTCGTDTHGVNLLRRL
ncbi:MAG TPA: PHP domain-containing protein [Leptolyngbyaceae cyanobacterium M65_K2018_010]|nr:PHP domain-containing protein [Leptolyngbyaceae cyanobacterium M65_K2018_010]